MLTLAAQAQSSPVVATLTVGTSPYGMVVSPDGTTVYVANSGSNNVSVIDTSTNTVEPTPIPAGTSPNELAISPNGEYLYVANSIPINGTVSVISTSTRALVKTIAAVGDDPTSIAITPNGEKLYVANFNSDTVSVIKTRDDHVLSPPISLGQSIGEAVAFTPDGAYAYVANAGSNDISVIEVAGNKLVGSPFPAGLVPDGITFTPDGKKAYIEDWGNKGTGTTISVIDVATKAITKTITVGEGPSQSAITPNGRYLFVPMQGNNQPPPVTGTTVKIIDTATDAVFGEPISVGNEPGFAVITPNGEFVYVANVADNTVSVINVRKALRAK